MKRWGFGAFLFFAVLFFSCNRNGIRAGENTNEQPTDDSLNVVVAPPADTLQTSDTILIDESPYLTLRFERTSCYGHCPVFVFKVYSNGDASYEGKKHVEKIGIYLTSLEEADLNAIRELASEVDLLDMSEQYPESGQLIPDLPNTITEYTIGGRTIAIVNNHHAPENLEVFESYIENLIEELNWQISVD